MNGSFVSDKIGSTPELRVAGLYAAIVEAGTDEVWCVGHLEDDT
jgi:hypothetical protein